MGLGLSTGWERLRNSLDRLRCHIDTVFNVQYNESTQPQILSLLWDSKRLRTFAQASVRVRLHC